MKFLNYSQYFDNKIKLFLTQSDPFWDRDYPISRKQKISEKFHLEDKSIIIPKQVHGNEVAVLSDRLKEPECDAIIYKANSNLVGAINIADCIPICIYDPLADNIALIHSGWRGTCKKIVIKAINVLQEIGSEKKMFKIFLGPSIKGCCYEVKKEFAQEFDLSSIIKDKGKYFVELSNQVKFDLERVQIPSENIIIDDLCTYDSLDCHSFRRDGKKAGRMTFFAYRD